MPEKGRDEQSGFEADEHGVLLFELEGKTETDATPKKRISTNAILTGAFGALLVGAIVVLTTTNDEPKKTKWAKPDGIQFVEGPEVYKRRETKPGEPQHEIRTVWNLNEDLIRIAPEIFIRVELKLLSGEIINEKTGVRRDLDQIEVRHVRIYARSDPWDAFSSQAKVELLHRTYQFLQSKYPRMTRHVRLIFDDNRADLPLKFDEDLSPG